MGSTRVMQMAAVRGVNGENPGDLDAALDTCITNSDWMWKKTRLKLVKLDIIMSYLTADPQKSYKFDCNGFGYKLDKFIKLFEDQGIFTKDEDNKTKDPEKVKPLLDQTDENLKGSVKLEKVKTILKSLVKRRRLADIHDKRRRLMQRLLDAE